MDLSNVGKAGAAAVGVIGLPSSIYFAHEHATSLYAVEREVIEKNVLFVMQNQTEESTHKIKITVSASDKASEGFEILSEGYSWSCEIEADSADGGVFWSGLKKSLPILNDSSAKEQNKKANKELLVRVCSRYRIETPSNVSVKSYVFAKKADNSKPEEKLFSDKEFNVLLQQGT